jgi:hypothetical protein
VDRRGFRRAADRLGRDRVPCAAHAYRGTPAAPTGSDMATSADTEGTTSSSCGEDSSANGVNCAPRVYTPDVTSADHGPCAYRNDGRCA